MDYFRSYLKVAPFSLALWRAQEARALKSVELKHPILDIGCGFGEFSGVFFDTMVEVGVDISHRDLFKAAQQKKYKKLVKVDARNMSFKDQAFNTVISISVLEHIKNTELVINEAFRVLKPGGNFVFTVPTNELNELLLLPFPKNLWLKIFHLTFKHQKIVNKSYWLDTVKKAGFKIIDCRGTISKRQIQLFQFGLPSSFPTQISRLILGKRLPVSPKVRVSLIEFLFKKYLNDNKLTNANIIVVAKKPK